MALSDPWYVRLRQGLLRFWRTEDSRLAAARDILVAGLVVFLLLGAVWGYTGQRFPSQAPLVVVESGSMMHGRCQLGIAENCFAPRFDDPPFGRVGTIDPGDLVFVKKVRSLDDVEDAFGGRGRGGYGGHGDVLVYKPGGSSKATPIIHRAMLLVRVHEENCTPNAASNPCKYILPAACYPEFGEYAEQDGWQKFCQGSSDPITLTLRRGGLSLTLSGYPCPSTTTCVPFRSGFLTKGDNNPNMDEPAGPGQVGGSISPGPVELEWIVGKARGEIPWFGLIKLALFGNPNYKCGKGQPCSDPTRASQWTLFRATAPYDIWVALFIAIAVLIGIPIVFDVAVNRWRNRRARRKPPSD